jgi:threonine dehydrogenase-like Zn-dependent dehydrogenase
MSAGEIDDAEAAHAEREAGDAGVFDEETFVIRAAMEHRRGHGSDAAFGIVTRWGVSETADTAHALFHLRG